MPKYNLADVKLGTLMDDPEALAIIEKHVPELQKLPMLSMAKKMSFNAVVGMASGQLGKSAVEAMREELGSL
ncbi:hypothetical protein [Salinibacterium sp.]|uniref:hypothetical protein n=1 Tax=Salinibacterium sp. TaxID=1915057 RepID=UPI002869FBA7|nr:hypothetical protein [Salinibacterium sp.]